MELEKLKEKLGADYETLEEYVNTLVSQRDQARNESISQRKALKSENAELKTLRDRMFETLGISDVEELDSLPTAKGAAEAQKQYEARVKKLERELGERNTALEAATKRYRDAQQSAALAKAVSAFEWVDAEIVSTVLNSRVVWEDDELFYRHTDGSVMDLAEGVKSFAAEKKSLLKSQGSGGSGYTPNGGAGKQENPFLRGPTFNLTKQGELMRSNPQLANQLMEAAKSAA